jgi:hypothetical protein
MQHNHYIKEWIEKVSKSRPELGGFSICPFAKRSHYKIVETSIDSIKVEDGYDVIIYIVDENSIETIQNWVEIYNAKFVDWLFFEDCFGQPTFINGVQTNNEKYNLILAQPKEKLRKFREILKRSDYYSLWDKDYYDKIMIDDQRVSN